MTEFITTQERQEIERREAEIAAHREIEAETLRQRNADLQRQAAEREKQWEHDAAIASEQNLAQRGREIEALLQSERNEAARLRSEIENELELKALQRELASTRTDIVRDPLTEINPDAGARLAMFSALVDLWPARKANLQEQVGRVETHIKTLEAQLAETTGLFSKASAAVAKVLKRVGATVDRGPAKMSAA
jgi:chromosome segregation ATPase